jgi:hypothetical protein
MSRNFEFHAGISRILGGAAIVAALFGLPAAAQSRAAAAAPVITPRVEIFAGYSYLYPNATASGLLSGGIVPVNSCLCAITRGGGASVTYSFNRWFGLTLDTSAHVGGKSGTPAQRIGNADAYNLSFGPQFKVRNHRLSPFAEALFGGDRLAPSLFHQDTGFGLLAGGGLDLALSHHISARLVQADFVYANHNFSPSPATTTQERGLRLQAGVVFAFGGAAPSIPVPAAPAPVAPVPAPAPARVEHLSLSASANPASIIAGNSSTINAVGVSSLNRPLTFSYSSTIGTISGNTATAQLTTAGASAGTAIVTVSVFDDMGQTAAATVPVTLLAPRPSPIVPVATSNLCTMNFARDHVRPARVNNEAKACLDEIALDMERNSTARLALVGSAALLEHHRDRLAADRATHARAYLVTEKGIDPSRIDIYTSTTDAKAVSSTLIPAGATLDTTGLMPVPTTR